MDEKITHSLLLITSKVINVIINCLSIKINSVNSPTPPFLIGMSFDLLRSPSI